MTRLERLRERANRNRRDARLSGTGRVLATLLVIVGGCDVVSTNVALAAGQVEANPLVTMLQSEFGTWWSVPKIAFHLLFAMLILWLPSKKMLSIARFVILAYAVIVVNNIYMAGLLA